MSENHTKRHCGIALLAHVDAGKTTLSEALLYQAQAIRSLGRVDHQNSFLDYDYQERKRGITIYLKQAVFEWKNLNITLLDTPGHTDFSAEMERTLQVLDAAIVLISAPSGIQAHTKTIWKLLESYRIPTFIFINKMDLSYQSEEEIMQQLQDELSEHCVLFSSSSKEEHCALCSDELLEYYSEHGKLEPALIQQAIRQRQIFPCYSGSALKQINVKELLDGLNEYLPYPEYPNEFGAKVFKISRDIQGNRLTHIKITGGSLKAKACIGDEKIDQIRIYSGNKFIMVNEAHAGQICCLKGPQNLHIQDGLGFEERGKDPLLSPCLSYRMILSEKNDEFQVFRQLKQLEEENPELHLSYSADKKIHVELMGEIQIEILKQVIADRFHLEVSFDHGSINYKETIAHAVEGIGHYEPLRHYAEVHLLLEPLKAGSGVIIDTACPTDVLDAHWQKLILSILDSQSLNGVLTNSTLTDIKITLLSGKAHLKHTEGQDFHQATMRALRQGLKSCESILLEPIYRFEIEVPNENASKALFDLETKQAQCTIEQTINQTTLIHGTAPVSTMQNYDTELRSYTHGKGRMSCTFSGYQPCGNQQKVIDEIGYNSDSDLDNPADSVFCSHGAGFVVKWYDIDQYMHLERAYKPIKEAPSIVYKRQSISDEELKAVMNKTYKPKERYTEPRKAVKKELPDKLEVKIIEKKTECLLIDGYNMIHAWDDLKQLAQEDLAASRDALIQQLANYHGYRKGIFIVVFDAYKVKENPGSIVKNENFYVVFTKSSQTADTYIEKATHHLAKDYRVTVATSDGMEQLIIMGQGALRLSARELKNEMNKHIKAYQNKTNKELGHRPMQDLKKQFDEKNAK